MTVKTDFIDNNTPPDSVNAAWLNEVGTKANTAYQVVDDDLTAIAALSPTNDDVLQRKSGAWSNRSLAQLKTDLSLQPLDSDLTAIAGLTPTNDDVVQRKSGAWTNRTMVQLKADLGIATDIANAVAAAQQTVINTQTDNYTLVASDANKAVHMNKATAVNATINAGVHAVGDTGEIVQVGAGQVTVVQGTSVTINKSDSLKTRKQWSSVYWHCYATNTFLLTGDQE